MKRLTAAMMATIGAICVANAQVYENTDFESPRFSIGNLNGQGGSAKFNKRWECFPHAGQTATISNGQAVSGSQSIAITSGPSNPGPVPVFGATWFGANNVQTQYKPTINPNKLFSLEANVWLGHTSDGSGDECYAGIDVGFGNADLEIGSQTGRMYVYTPFTPAGGINNAGDPGMWTFAGWPVAQLNAWNNLKLVLDYSAAGPPVQYIYLNGIGVNATAVGCISALVGTNSIDNAAVIVENGHAEFGDTQTVTAYFDDFKAQAVPEPSTLAALALGAIVLLRRRRR